LSFIIVVVVGRGKVGEWRQQSEIANMCTVNPHPHPLNLFLFHLNSISTAT
jgi:hypothetical protein